MSVTKPEQTEAPVEMVTITVDEVEVSVPKGTMIIRAAEQAGIQIPRFCDHPLLDPVGACRQCLVEVSMPGRDGNISKMPKPQPSCAMAVAPGMQVETQRTSEVADVAQHGVMEFLLINHPLDCPICDKGGECPLQNQAMSNGRTTSRFIETKRTYAKPVNITTQILLDRERCILCQRCTRFAEQVAGDPFIALQMRGAKSQVGRFDPTILDVTPVREGEKTDELVNAVPTLDGDRFASYFAGNVIQICPVGALTSAKYRFRARPFDLVSTPSVSEHDSSGSDLRVDHRRGTVVRRLAGNDPLVNEEWLSDKDRFAFSWQTLPSRLTKPITFTDSVSETLSWPAAIRAAAEGLKEKRVGVLTGGRLTLEDSYAYSVFARRVLHTNDIDFRSRSHSAEESEFLEHAVAGSGIGVTFGNLEKSPGVLLVGFEPEEEGGVVFLRLRKAFRKSGTRVFSLAPFSTEGLARVGGTLLKTAPGTEPDVLDAIAPGSESILGDAAQALAGGVIVVGERLATIPGAYSAAVRAAERLGARLAWIPRRAGERGSLEAGCLPTLLPGGRSVSDADARNALAGLWGTEPPSEPGRDTTAILQAAADGELDALVVAGLELNDLPDPDLARRAFERAFVVRLTVLSDADIALSNLVLPIAPAAEKPGTFVNWEGRNRPFGQVLVSQSLSDARVLQLISRELGIDIDVRDLGAVHRAFDALGPAAARASAPQFSAQPPTAPPGGHAVLASWRLLLDDAALQQGDEFLAAIAKAPHARLSPATAAEVGASDSDLVKVGAADGRSVEVPLFITDMPDGVVWLPMKSHGCDIHGMLGANVGDVLSITTTTQGESQ